MKRILLFIFAFLSSFVVYGATFYVVEGGAGNKNGSSWANAYADVQTAIDKAYNAGGGEVWIAKGTYKHGSAMAMKNNVAIFGGFAGTETSKDQRVSGNNTYLDGEGKYRVFYNNYTESNPLTNSAKLDNVTIQNGYISGSGAGMYNYYASPEITNCTFSGNTAYNGGGMYNSDSSSPVLTNCTFSNNSASRGGGMYNSSSSPVLTNCTFSGNSAIYGGGMYNDESSPTLTNCTFSGNSADRGGGMDNFYSSPVLTNCILWGNTATSNGYEIYNYSYNNYYSKPTIDTCVIKGGVDEIYGNEYGTYTNIITADPKLMPLSNYGGSVQTCPVGVGSSAISKGKKISGIITDARGFARSSTPTIGACEYQNKFIVASISTTEGYLKYSSAYEFTLNANVSDIGGTFTYQWYKDGVAISGATSSSYKTSQSVGTSKYTVEVSDGTTTITSSEIAVETINPVIYVSTEGSAENDGLSWATAKNDIQEAIDLASKYYGSEVWIAKGTYKHGSEMTMKNNVAIYGGFAGTETSKEERVAGNNTILDGEGEYSVFYNSNIDNSAKLDNVTIQNGYTSGSGAGMVNVYASPEITNCTFSNNYAKYGGGMYNGSSSSPVLTNCTFSGNTAYNGGGMYNVDSSPVLTNCTFSNNSASRGGGMYNSSSSPTLTNCTFSNNSGNSASSYGGGMYNYYNSSPVLTNCTFVNNSASSGGGMYNSSSSPVLTNCSFVNNTAEDAGGGMYNYYSSPTLTNCTFSNNSTTGNPSYGGGMYNEESSPTLTNCTFSGNSAIYGGGMYNYYNSSPVLTNCTFSGNSVCNNNYSSPVLTNCILWGNTATSSGNEIYNRDSNCKPTIDTCIIKGGYSSYGTYTNIITADPKLMPLGNYGGSVSTMLVASGSSAIGAGKVVDDVTTDARGMSRSSKPTIGACEFANKLTVASISTSEGYLKYSSSYEFTLNVNVSDIDVTKVNLTYQWYKDGVAISGATSSSYKASQSVGISKYTVRVSDGTTTITSSGIAIETVDTPRYYVSTIGNSSNDGLSWATAKNNVQEAIDLAATHNIGGAEVWIAKGTYKHGFAMTMKNGVAIYGGFKGTETSKEERVAGNETILDGEGKYRVFYNRYTADNPLTNSAKLDNVTIQNGSGSGAGMYNYCASPEITNCTFTNNSGGGMYNGSGSSPVLTNCTFVNNSASSGGGMCNSSSSPVLTNCSFVNNTAEDAGGGMYNGSGSSPTLTNCTFANNYAKYGGGMYNRESSSPVLTNCTFSGNSVSYGGGMCNSSSSPTLTNCTFANNYAKYGGGMYNSSSSSPTLTNCILWGNTASSSGNEIYNNGSNNKPTIDTCIIKGGYSSYGTYTNIIETDPMLMPLGNYGGSVFTCSVAEGSSAIGAGKVVEGVTTDARGYTRSTTAPTIGAYEYGASSSEPSESSDIIVSALSDVQIWEGQSYTYTLDVKAEGKLKYMWQVDKLDGKGWVKAGSTKDSLKVSAKANMKGWKYRCEVSNGDDTVMSNVSTLDVLTKAKIETQPTVDAVALGGTLTLTAGATGDNLKYQWQKKVGKEWVNISGKTSETLTISGLTSADNNTEYRCVVSNDGSSVTTKSVKVPVVSKPTYTIDEKKHVPEVAIIEGKKNKATFAIKATKPKGETGTYKYQWYKNGEPIAKATKATYTTDVLTEADFERDSTDNIYYTKDTYYCVISVDVKKQIITSKPTENFRVMKLEPAKILVNPEDKVVSSSEDATFTAEVTKTSGVKAVYQWQVCAFGSDPENPKNWKNAGKGKTLTLKKATVKLSGNLYRCQVSNDLNKKDPDTSAYAKLEVKGAPIIKTQPKAITTYEGLDLELMALVSGYDLTYQWQVSADGKTGWETLSEDDFLLLLEDVESTFFYQFVAYNDENEVVYSKSAKVTVKAKVEVEDISVSQNKLPVEVNNYSAKVVSTADVVLSVTATGDSPKYEWQVSDDGIYWTPIKGATKKTYTIKKTNLIIENDRMFRCRVYNGTGKIGTDSYIGTEDFSDAVMIIVK